MFSTLAVLTVIIGTINIMNYRSVTSSADEVLAMLEANGGAFPDPFGKGGIGKEFPGASETQNTENLTVPGPGSFTKRGKGISPETPYESRYFSVTFSADGTITDVDASRIAAVDETAAENFATTVYESGKARGFRGDYRYLVYSTDDSGNNVNDMAANGNGNDAGAGDSTKDTSDTMSGPAARTVILFLDCSRSLDNFRTFLFVSILVSALGMAAVFLLVFLLSRRVVKPMEESYNKQRQFITDAGHELRTPLTIIDADVSVLEMDIGKNEWIDDVKTQTKRLSGLTNDLVYLSRMEEGSSQLQMIDFPVSDVVSEIAGSYRARAQVEEKEFKADITPMLNLCGDEKSISKVVNILLDNAMKYSSDHGQISLTLHPHGKGKGVELVVTNTVDGMDEQTIAHLFDRFYRGDSSRNSEKGGYGIGLSIVAAVVAAHKGKVSASLPDPHTFRVDVMLG